MPILQLNDGIIIAFIGSLAAIIASLNGIYKTYMGGKKEKLDKLERENNDLKEVVDKQADEILHLRLRINSLSAQIEFLVPFLKRKFSDDPEMMEALQKLGIHEEN